MPLQRGEVPIVVGAALVVFSRVFGVSVVIPDFRAFGASLTGSDLFIGIAFGASSLTLAVMQIPMGLLSDRFGRRPILLLGTALFVGGSVLAAFATTIWLLIAAMLIQGLGAVSSVAMAMVGESVPEERRTLAMALVGIPAGTGFMLGMIVGPLLSPVIGVSGLFILTAAIAGAAVLPLVFAKPADAIPRHGIGHIGRAVVTLALAGFTGNYALRTVMFYLPDEGRTFLVPTLVVALFVMLVASRAIDKTGAARIPAALGLLVLGAGGAAYVLGAGPLLLAGGALFFSAHATLSAFLPSQVSRLSGTAGGRGHGIQNVVAYFGGFLGAAVAGLLATTPWAAMVILAGLCVVIAGANFVVLVPQRSSEAPS